MRAGAAEGLDILARRRRGSGPGLLLSADPGHRRRAGLDPHARGDLRTGSGRPRPSARRTRRWRSPTTPATGSPPRSGPRTSTGRSRSRRGSRPASSGSIRPTCSTPRPASAAIARAASAARAAARAFSNTASPTRRGRQALSGGGAAARAPCRGPLRRTTALRGIDRTAKLYVGGKQARPDAGASYAVLDPKGREVGLAGLGNRKDIRNAVEAAAKASSWGAATAHNRAQVLYYVAENLSARAERVRGPARGDDRRLGARRRGRGRRLDPARLLLRRLRRQVSTAPSTRRARDS